MSWTWENWKNKKEIVHRNNKGQFKKGNMHFPLKWKESHKVAVNKKEYREKTSKRMKGNKLSVGLSRSLTFRKKISEAKKGIPLSKKHKQKISRANKGFKHSKEARQKISKAHKGRTITKEHREKISNSLKGTKHSVEQIAKQSKALKEWWRSRQFYYEVIKEKEDRTSLSPRLLKTLKIISTLGKVTVKDVINISKSKYITELHYLALLVKKGFIRKVEVKY